MFEQIKTHWFNYRGFRIDQKIVIFESDDWGSIRMPSRRVYENLQNSLNGIQVSVFDRFDCLESSNDLSALGEVLFNFQDHYGSHPVFTCNMVLQNPNFDAIRNSHFQEYIPESFFSSYQRTWGQDLRPQWLLLQKVGVLKPQFHAREHLNVDLWINDLRNGNVATLESFGMGFFGQKQQTGSMHQYHYLAAYHAQDAKDVLRKSLILQDGLKLFEETFGFKSITFIPCNYTWVDELTQHLPMLGVKALQGNRVMQLADVNCNGKLVRQRRMMNFDPQNTLINFVRNVEFEPYALPDGSAISKALGQISSAFKFGKPAVISTHRINFVGGLDINSRDNNLLQLKGLISNILKRWPDVRFMSSDQLLLEFSC